MIETENSITSSGHDSANQGRGSYILLIELQEEKIITIGSLKRKHFPRGYYAYVGSAMGGFKARLSRHIKTERNPHWHIDYLLSVAAITDIILCQTQDRVECIIARALSRQYLSVPGFGSSDCKCHSHLFFTTTGRQMKTDAISTITRLGIKPVVKAGSSLFI